LAMRCYRWDGGWGNTGKQFGPPKGVIVTNTVGPG
jgi:hypothetical protein